jgi:hypothetical protein
VPGAAGELVDLVPGLAAEQLGQRGGALRHPADGEHARVAAAAVRQRPSPHRIRGCGVERVEIVHLEG